MSAFIIVVIAVAVTVVVVFVVLVIISLGSLRNYDEKNDVKTSKRRERETETRTFWAAKGN